MGDLLGLEEILTRQVSFELFGTMHSYGFFQFGVMLGCMTFLLAVMLNIRAPMSRGLGMDFIRSVITAPIMEEIIFRLILISILTQVFGSVILAIIVSAFAFGMIHIAYGGMRFVDSFVAGLLWGWAFVNIGIGVTIIAHMTHNVLASMIGG